MNKTRGLLESEQEFKSHLRHPVENNLKVKLKTLSSHSPIICDWNGSPKLMEISFNPLVLN